MAIDASVIISYINSEDTLPELLSRLERQDYPRDRYEIITVNGDDYIPRASEAKGQIIGVEKSVGAIVFFTNSDRFPPSNWISSHMAFYPEFDMVVGNVNHHRTDTIQALNFGNISMKREVIETIPIRDIISQQDADFAFRFIQQNRFKAVLGGVSIEEPLSQHWTWRHHYLMARNIMVLRREYKMLPRFEDIFRIRHPAALVGGINGMLGRKQIVNAHV